MKLVGLTLLGLAALVACGGDDADSTSSSSSNSNSSSSSGGAGGSTSATGGGGSTASSSSGGEVPTGSAALVPWLEAGSYTGWTTEADVHESTGPHFGNVKVFVNDTLKASLDAGNSEHPVGSAAVKELYGNGTTIGGWSVSLKTAAGTDGTSWYWFEDYNGQNFADGNGVSLCTNCHGGGTDFFLSPYPL